MEIIAAHAAAAGLRTERVKEILQCVACDDALRILREEGLCEIDNRRCICPPLNELPAIYPVLR